MKTYSTELRLAAPPETVWTALTHFALWSTWNPIIPAIRGTPRRGGWLILSLVSPMLPLRRALPVWVRVRAFDPPRELRWIGGVPGLFTGEHGWRLTSEGGGTHVIHQETFRGVLVPLLRRVMDRTLPGSYDAMNSGLTRHLAGGSTSTVASPNT